MKSNMTKTLSAALSLGALSSLPTMAEDKKDDATKDTTQAIAELLEARGVCDATIEKTLKAVEDAWATSPQASDVAVETKVLSKAMIIGPDGQLRMIEDGELGEELGTAILKWSQGHGAEASTKPEAMLSGKFKLIGPNGEVTETDLDFNNPLDLGQIPQEAKELLESLASGGDMMGVGPGVILKPGEFFISPAVGQIEDRGEQMEELQRKLTEQTEALRLALDARKQLPKIEDFEIRTEELMQKIKEQLNQSEELMQKFKEQRNQSEELRQRLEEQRELLEKILSKFD